MPSWHQPWLALLLLLPFPAFPLSERSLKQLSPAEITSLVSTPDPLKNLDPYDPKSHLSHILIPRAPQTENNTLVRNYIISTLKALNWEIEEDEFSAETPVGQRTFVNVVATKDPSASRRVILSAHFDSKYFDHSPDDQFVGATDSAAPCAMMLDLAEALNPLFDTRAKRAETDIDEDEDVADTTLQLVFFDGEEAFFTWTDTDSIYGAKHLAEKWSTTYVQPHSKRRLLGPSTTELQMVDVLILLDLLGAPGPRIQSYYPETAWLFDVMVSSERRLGEAGHYAYGDEQSMKPGDWKSWFVQRKGEQRAYMGVGDDHVPFLKKGVSILHVIANPFPRVWHTIKDDASALDKTTMRRWNLILRVFFAEYLNLRPEVEEEDERQMNDPQLQRSMSELVSVYFNNRSQAAFMTIPMCQ